MTVQPKPSFKNLFTNFVRLLTRKNGTEATWAFILSEEEARSLWEAIG